MKKPLGVAVVSLLLCLPSCLFGSTSSVDYEGRYVSEEQMLQIDQGVAEAEVVALLGAPSNKSELGDGKALWTWHYTRREKSSSQIFLLLASKHEESFEGTVFVRFDQGKVEKVWRS